MHTNSRKYVLGALASASLIFGFACSGTSGNEDDGLDDGSTQANGSGGNANQGTGGSGQTTGEGGDLTVGVGVGGSTGQGGSCVDIEVESEQVLKPADIIFVIDNSGSMNDEIASVEQNINVNFAAIMGASQLDYQVIMVTNHGSGSYDVCIGPPLSNSSNCNAAPGDVPGQFHHYDIDVQSYDSLCIALDTLYGTNNGGEADEWNLHPEGYSKWLRQNAIKIFVEITDDDINCTWNGTQLLDYNDTNAQSPTGDSATTAINFDSMLLAEAPSQFGTTAARNYQFYSIIGIPEKANPQEPYQPGEPVIGASSSASCTSSNAYGPGWGYQWLSKGTNGLRFPVCQFASYDAVFQAIAAGVIDGASLPCEFDISGNSEPVDPNSLLVEYAPGMGPQENFSQVMGQAACGVNDQAFYLDGDLVKLCPATCDKVTADPSANLSVIAQCAGTAE